MTSHISTGLNSVGKLWAVSPAVGLGRSIVALAQASVLLFSDTRGFFVPVGDATFESACADYLGQISLFCTMDSQQSASILTILVLLAVASGVLPRYTCLLHAYVSVSFVGVLSLPDGGDLIAANITLLLIFVYLGDSRVWHWMQGESRSITWRGISKGAQIAVRVQVAYIYFDSATAKFAVETWAEGTQMYYVTRQEMFGASGLVGQVARDLTTHPVITLASSWGAIVIELCIAILIFVPNKFAARTAILMCTFLHVLIIALIGLGSFGLIMIGVVICAVGSRFCRLEDVVPKELCTRIRELIRPRSISRRPSPQGGSLV
ncbi:HTTM domain-containing protein [Leifsonia shinshuensis]|uniref:sporulation-delaying protein SdpB family protein n=1 Tax=Leifsonia shinshuensis TaxID=150026 RepID=UPI001F507DBE|nr:sporulation-delaying protein SdpB family protein [Leifsonia shinshuensis]MCI0157655.1 HTTM domain-containing protein [Leifsonia shinshuensis]